MASKDKIYMVMEFMPGGELFDKIVADGPLEVSLIQAIFTLHAQDRTGRGLAQWCDNGAVQCRLQRRKCRTLSDEKPVVLHSLCSHGSS